MSKPLRVPPPEAEPLHQRAAENLSFIRATMERAAPLTAVPGWGGVAMGGSALLAAWLASRQTNPAEWLLVWLAEAILALSIGGYSFVRKATRTGQSGFSYAGRQFAGNFAPPLVAGGLLTPVLYQAGRIDLLPGVWLLLYGTAVTTAGAFSIRIVPIMGLCLMVVGGAALFAGPGSGDWFMALGFGLIQIGFGLVIARRYGG